MIDYETEELMYEQVFSPTPFFFLTYFGRSIDCFMLRYSLPADFLLMFDLLSFLLIYLLIIYLISVCRTVHLLSPAWYINLECQALFFLLYTVVLKICWAHGTQV